MRKWTFLTILLCCVSFLSVVGCNHSVSKSDMAALIAGELPDGAMWVESLDLRYVKTGSRIIEPARSVDGNPITIAGVTYPHGIGGHAVMDLSIALHGCATRFVSMVGVDDEGEGQGSVRFKVYVDGELKADSGVMLGLEPAKLIDVDLTDANVLRLYVEDANEVSPELPQHYDHADWAGAFIQLSEDCEKQPVVIREIPIADPIPMASGDRPQPEIHGPRIVGATPGREFMFHIPATGHGKLTYKAENLPEGLTLDADTGIITGSLSSEGETKVKITVSGQEGSDSRNLTIVGGEHKLALTPPMGWNSWNIFGLAVTAEDIKRTADMMVETGLADYGFTYINIDDGWEADERDENGVLGSNAKFPDMKELADYVHSKGLKLGIYSSPGPKTCGLFLGSYQHELLDAQTWAEWGIDYLKYDWCLYEDIAKDHSLPELKKPYFLMREMLDKVDRDIVYSLCQYGMGDVWEWGAEVGGDLWRTTGDIVDTWESMSSIGFDQNGSPEYAGPSNWNDPDMMVVGWVGWGVKPYPSRLLPNEQVTHVTLWALQAAPMLLGCDLRQMDAFTLDLLKNHDVIEINQDPLGIQAKKIVDLGHLEIWSKELWDGTIAVGLFNRGPIEKKFSVKWKHLGLSNKPQLVYDVWQRKSMGKHRFGYAGEVPAHGALLYKIGKPQKQDF